MYKVKDYRKRRIIFAGNSLSWYSGNNTNFGMRFPLSVYSSIVSSGKEYSFKNISTGGIQTSQMITNFSTSLAPFIQPNDIVIFWELVNDLRVTDDATIAYNNAVAYCDLIRNAGAKCVLLTCIATNFSGNPPDMDTIRQTLNTNLRNNASSICDLLVDTASISEFDTVADTANTTYYNADLVHLTDTGYNLIGTNVYSTISSIL